MSKSRARLLAELLNASGRVKKDKSQLTGGDDTIDLDTLPTITNAKLENSSISIAGHSTALGGSVSLNTGDITEHTDYKYYTDARARGAISVSGSTISYNSTTGVITSTANNYVLPTATSSSLGGVKIGYTENGKNYPVELSSGQMYVNVPWVDTNTTYSVGDGGLTQKNFTTTLKDKLDGIAANANNYVLPFTDNSSNWNTAYGWGNHASQGYITNATASLDASKITGGTLNSARIPVPANGDWWNNGYVRVQTDGVMEVGKYLDFHTADSGGGTDYDVRITASSGAIDIDGDLTVDDVTISGNLTVTGTVDGRDIASDGSKLDGIESGATADQTQSDINALGITATGLSGTPNISVGTIASGAITSSGDIDAAGDIYTGSSNSRFKENQLRFNASGASYIDQATTGQTLYFRTSNNSSLDTTWLEANSAGQATFGGNVIVEGNLTVSGTTTTIDTANLNVEDNNITLNYSTGDSSASANGAGITIQDAVNSTTDASITWSATNDRFVFSHPIQVASIHSGNKVSFLDGSAAQGARFGSIYVGTSYASDGSASGTIDTLNGYRVQGTTRINSVGDIIGTSYYVGSTNIVDTNRNLTNIGNITSTGLTVDYTGHRTGDAGILVTNDASDWGIKILKDSTTDYGMLVQTDGAHAFMIRNKAGTQRALISASTGNATFAGSVTGTYFLASGGDSTPAGTTFSNVLKGSNSRTAYFDSGDSTTVSTWYGNANTPFAAIDATNGNLKLYVNDTSGNWHQKIGMTSSGVTHYGTVTSTGVFNKIDSGSYAYFEADGNTNEWKWLRLSTNGTTAWDIAARNNDLSNALQFRPSGGSTNRTSMSTAGDWTFGGRITVGDTSETQKIVLDFDTGGNMILGNDGSYGTTGNGRYTTLGFGGTTNGSNRIFAHNGTTDGMYFAAATGRGFYWRVNGTGNNSMELSSGGELTVNSGNIKVRADGSYGASYGTIGFGGSSTGSNRISGRNSADDGLFLHSATGRDIFFRTNGSASNKFVMTASGNFQVGSTTIIDSSRNLSNLNNVSGVGSYATQGSHSSYGTLRIAHPKGADVYSRASSQTGAIKITLPQSWTSTMMWFTIEVYEYAGNEAFTVKVGGYNYSSSSTWLNQTATITSNGNKDRNFTVRFAHDGSKCCIFIGDLTSTWSYPQVAVTNFIAGFSNATLANWDDGWDASFETSSYGTVSGTHTQTDSNIHHTNIKIGSTEIISTGRVLYNTTLGHSNTGARFEINDWMYDTGGYKRFYFENAGRTFYGAQTGHQFRDSGDTTRFNISNSGGINILSAGDTQAGSGEAINIAGTNILNSSRQLGNIPAAAFGQAISSMDTTNLDVESAGHMSIRGGSYLYFGITTNNHNSWKNRITGFNTSTLHINAQGLQVDNTGYANPATVWLKANNSEISHKGNTIWHAGNDGSGSGLDADLLDGYHLSGSSSIATKIFNNKGQNHATVTNFNTSMTPGPNYIQSYTNGPENTGQWYGFMLGLGNDYGTTTGSSGHYASQMYYKRNASNNANYLYMRSMESGSWGSWLKVTAGYADSAGNADTVDGVHESTFMRKVANSGLDMNNNNITEINALQINDPGPTEGLEWMNGNGWKIVECPDNMSSNSAGNLQFATGSTRRMTVDTSGNATALGSLRAPIFYDSNNTGYYMHLDGNSYINSIDTAGPVGRFEDKAYVEFYVHGSSESTYYPVVIGLASEGYAYKDYSISRRYNWTAPNSWYSSTHKGGLTLTWQHSGDTAWGGNDKEWRVIQFDETYSQVCQGLTLSVTGGMVVWLRGGGTSGARYRLHSPKGKAASVTIYDGTTSGYSGGGTHNSSTTFTSGNSTNYSAESANTTTRDNRIKPYWPVRDRGYLYHNGNAVWHTANDGSGSGLDADLLDGLDSSIFFKSYTNNNGGWSNSNRNFSVRTGGNAVGLHMEESDGTFGLQLYGDGSNYGFLDGEWAAWDLKKQINGTFMVDEGSGLKRVLNEANWSSYITIPTSLPANGGNSDTVDSLHASQFVRSDASDTMSGELNVTHNGGVTGTGAPTYTQANIELQTSSNHVPAISFHRGGYSATTLYEYDGELYVNAWVSRNQTGKLVSFGNDGSGSTLDADLLDGQHGSYYAKYDDFRSLGTQAFTGTASTAGLISEMEGDGAFDSYTSAFKTSWSYAGNFNMSDAGRFTETAGTAFLTWTDNSSDSARGNITVLAIAPNTGGSAGKMFVYNDQGPTYAPGWREIWTSTSDGSGSGLDADLLDGNHASAFLGVSAKAADSNLFDGIDSAHFVYGDNSTGSGNTSPTNTLKSGFYNSSSAGNPTSTWYITFHGRHTNTTNNYGHQIAGSFYSTGDIYNRNINNNSFGSWTKIWNASNDGAGSGLDADNLDGVTWGSYKSTGATYLNFQASNFYGLRFWNGSSNYTIYMSSQGASGAGRVSGETTSDYNMYFRMAGGTNRGFVFQNGTNVKAGIDGGGNARFVGNVTAYASDVRLKENIKPIENALEKLDKIRGVTFDWKDNIENFDPKCKTETGVIAQEIEAVIPDAISPAPFNEDYKTVEKDKIIALLIEAVKELKQEVVDLKTQIKEK